MSSRATPSPAAYIRPSFHCAMAWPSSAAYSSAFTLSVGIGAGVAAFLLTIAGGPEITGIVVSFWLTGAPSNASAGTATSAVPTINATMVRLDVRIALFLVRATRMGYGPSHRRPNLLGIFPERARRVIRLARAPFGSAFRKLFVGQFYVK